MYLVILRSMYQHFFFWTFNYIQVYGFIIPEAYNVKFTDSAHFKIDVSLGEGALEMINNDQIQRFNVKDKENQFYELNRLAIVENNKIKKPIYWINLNDINVIPIKRKITLTTTNSKSMTSNSKRTAAIQISNKNYQSTFYDYDRFLKEYYYDTIDLDLHNETYHPKAEGQNLLESLKGLLYFGGGNYSRDTNNIGVRAVNSLRDLRERSCSTAKFAGRLWKLVKVWLLVYLAIAVPFWCTKGWCCCFLCCKFFKPYLTIEEAKSYYIQNPPGILKKPKGHTLYEPSEKERECYLELEHLIKIL